MSFLFSSLVEGLAVENEQLPDEDKKKNIEIKPIREEEVPQLEEVVVTAKEGKPTTFEVSPAITRIHTESLNRRAPRILPDVLRGEPGVSIQETTPGQGTPIIRGLLGSSTVMVVDGMRLNNAIFRSSPNQYYALVDPYNVEQLELRRGSSSTLFGEGAIGGVVSINTPIPRFDTSTWTLEGTVKGTFRSADLTRVARTTLEGGFQGLGLRGGFTYQGHDDLRGGGDIGRQSPSAYETFAGDGKIVIGDEHQNFMLNVQFLEQPKTPRFDQVTQGFGQDQPSSSEFFFEPNNRLFIHTRYLHYPRFSFLDRVEGNVSFQAINDNRRIRDFGSSERMIEKNQDRLWEINFHFHSSWKQFAMFRYGFQVLRDDVRSHRKAENVLTGETVSVPSRFANHSSIMSGAAYLQTTLQFSSLWDVTMGGRWTYVDINVPQADRPVGTHLSISEFTGDVGTVFHLTDTVNFVANFGRAFRAPNVFDLSTLGPRPGNRFNIPNANLAAEKAWSLDGGIKWETSKISGELIGFFLKIADKIESIPTGEITDEGRVVVQNANLNKVTLFGFETGVRWQWNEDGEVFGNLTFTWGEETTSSGNTNPADRIPPLNGRFGGAYHLTPYFRLESFVRVATSQNRLSPRDQSDPRINPDGTPGWVTLNFRTSYDFGRGFIGRFSLENALDQPYREHGSGIDAPGINAIFTAEARF